MQSSGLIGFAAIAIVTVAAPSAAHARYCAHYSVGTTSCGIPTLQSCLDSVSGVGGYCGPDQSAEIPVNFRQLFRGKPRRPAPPVPNPTWAPASPHG
jgi:hypothetical protein